MRKRKTLFDLRKKLRKRQQTLALVREHTGLGVDNWTEFQAVLLWLACKRLAER